MKAVREMYRQVGDLKINHAGIAEKGLLIRHLVMPNNIANTKEIMNFLVKEISKNIYVNIMPQYRPCDNANNYEELSTPISSKEYIVAIEDAKEVGIKRFDKL